MGWDVFNEDEFKSKGDVVRYLTRESRWTTGTRLLNYRVVGNNLWSLLECEDAAGLHRAIHLTKLMEPGDGMGWGTKSIDETAYPSEVNCPGSFLERAMPAPPGVQVAWRDEVREHHRKVAAARRLTAQLQPGQRVLYGDVDYVLRAKGDRGSWIVESESGCGKRYRMMAKQIGEAMWKLAESIALHTDTAAIDHVEQDVQQGAFAF